MAATIRASKQGLDIVEQARKEKGWTTTSVLWYGNAQTSAATLKRFREGKAIQTDAFIAICKTVGVNWEEVKDTPEKKVDKITIKIDISRDDFIKLSSNVLNILQEISEDKTLKIWGIYEGCVLLILEGSEQGLKRIDALFKAGELTEIMGIPVEDVSLDLEKVETIINLTQWLQNNFAETIETGWLTLEEIFGSKTPAFRSQAVKRAKQIQVGDIAINLLVDIDPQPNQEINLWLGVYPATESARLSDNLQIEIVMENGEVLMTYTTENDEEAVAWDDFFFEPGEQFALEISLGDLSHREYFIF